jgi:lipid A 4'-phosphatase
MSDTPNLTIANGGTRDETATGTESATAAPPILLPLALLLGLTALCETFDLDLAVSGAFYDAARGLWTHSGDQPWASIDQIGPIAGIVVGLIAGFVSVAGHSVRSLARYLSPATFVALALLIGPGLLVNGVLKSSWGRPRPNSVVELGGFEPHRRSFEPGADPVIHRSFPSGHASIGFFLMVPAFVFYRRRRGLYYGLIVWGLLFGVLMSSARIAQGSHFLTDVLWSAGLVYLSAALLYRAVDPEDVGEAEVQAPRTSEARVPSVAA